MKWRSPRPWRRSSGLRIEAKPAPLKTQRVRYPCLVPIRVTIRMIYFVGAQRPNQFSERILCATRQERGANSFFCLDEDQKMVPKYTKARACEVHRQSHMLVYSRDDFRYHLYSYLG